MSDEIRVRVRLDRFDFVHPQERQTQVYVQIPEVARATWLLDAGLFHGLKLCPWPNVLDAAIEDYDQRGVVSDTASATARAAVRAWLLEDPNRDEMQAAYELDEARRHPVARKLLNRIAELEAAAYGDARVRLFSPVEQIKHLHDALAAQLSRADTLNRLAKEAQERVAELEAAQGTVYRAEHPDSGITLGHYDAETAARAHCEATERRSWPTGTTLAFDWIEDNEDRVAELVVTAGQNEESTTGYIVTALELASEYDEEVDE